MEVINEFGYIKGLSKNLSKEEQVELFERYKEGDKRAGQLLVESCLAFVISYARRFEWANVPTEDLIQAGAEGLCTALTKYNPSYGTKFIGFATYDIDSQMKKLIRTQSAPVELGRGRDGRKVINNAFKVRKRIEKETGEIPSTKVVAEELGVSEQEVCLTLQAMGSAQSSSIYDIIYEGGSERLIDRIEGDSKSPEVIIDMKKFTKSLEEFGKGLTGIEKVIWEDRIISLDPETLALIGERMSLSKEWIRQIEKKIKTRFNEWAEINMEFV